MNLIYLLTAYGICFGIQNKMPFLRQIHPFFKELISCTYCLGTHCGWVAWLLVWVAEGHMPAAVAGGSTPTGWMVPVTIAVWAMATATFCYALDTVIQWLETRSA